MPKEQNGATGRVVVNLATLGGALALCARLKRASPFLWATPKRAPPCLLGQRGFAPLQPPFPLLPFTNGKPFVMGQLGGGERPRASLKFDRSPLTKYVLWCNRRPPPFLRRLFALARHQTNILCNFLRLQARAYRPLGKRARPMGGRMTGRAYSLGGVSLQTKTVHQKAYRFSL